MGNCVCTPVCDPSCNSIIWVYCDNDDVHMDIT